MHKIMMVEDEAKILNTILDTIKWNEHGFETPIGCHDGRDAIQKVEDGFYPSVLITDIYMPFIDGLELAEYFNKNLPDTIIVILTGYDDFNYTQKAIRLNVFDYVLKPLTPNKLYKLLDKLKETLNIMQIRNIDNKDDILKNHFLNQLTIKNIDIRQIEENCKTYKLNFYGQYHLAAVLDVDAPFPCTVEESNNLQLKRYGLFNISQEIVSNNPIGKNIVVFQSGEGITKLIIDANTIDKCHSAAYKFTELIISTISEFLNINVSAGIGEPVAYINKIYVSHLQAMIALNHRFFYGESSIIFSSDINFKMPEKIDYSSYEMCIMDSLKNLDLKSTRFVINNMITEFKQKHIDINHCILYSQRLAISLVSYTNKIVGINDKDTYNNIWGEFDFYSVSSISLLENILIEICDRTAKLINEVKESSSKMKVLEAENYIKENLNDNSLSLNKVAEHLSISTSYFTNIFKTHTGFTFTVYLNSARIEKAKHILLYSDMSIEEIAQNVGFTNTHYFNVIFKRLVGITPNQFRNRNFIKIKSGGK